MAERSLLVVDTTDCSHDGVVASFSLTRPDLNALRKPKVRSSPSQSDELAQLKRQLAGVV